MNKDELVRAVKMAKEAHDAAVRNLEDYDRDPKNYVYQSLEDAGGYLEEELRDRAFKDCEGSYNCGDDEYRQGFFVDGVEHIAIAKFEYNRHDKTYYYIDGCDFHMEKV